MYETIDYPWVYGNRIYLSAIKDYKIQRKLNYEIGRLDNGWVKSQFLLMAVNTLLLACYSTYCYVNVCTSVVALYKSHSKVEFLQT